jgi:uncharacterized protein (TIGR04551 family)
VAIFGQVESIADMVDPDTNNPLTDEVDLRKFGAVARGGYRLLEGDIRLGFEIGYASGDQWDNLPAGRTHVRNARLLPGEGDTTANAFRFNFDHEVDMILFRELLGTVSNATYLKPSLDWKIGGGFRAKGAGIVSFANVPVATPGNSEMYGIELNADFGYEKNGFFAGIAYGVLFPLAAMNHPTAGAQDGPGFGFGTNAGDAETAQTIQSRLILSF